MTSHIDAMQRAVDIVNNSPHPTNKVAASLWCKGGSESDITAHTNFWPTPIRDAFSQDQRFGGASGSVHAETTCLINATHKTEGGSLYVTDPFCPNCAKNIAEAGIKNIFIDHKGFAKDFARRRGQEFENLSMKICHAAGVNVYELHRKDGWIIPILVHPADYLAKQDNPVEITPTNIKNDADFKAYIKALLDIREFDHSFAIGYGDGQIILAQRHLSIGYLEDKADPEVLNPEGKYSFWLEPCNRLLMAAARHGVKLDTRYIFSSQHPSAREQINLIGAKVSRVIIGDINACRDENGPKSYEVLKAQNILNFISLD